MNIVIFQREKNKFDNFIDIFVES